jgi:SAM-dependent methyltransferase
MTVKGVFLAALLAFAALAQVADFEAYLEFRKWVQSLPNEQRGDQAEQIRRYSEKLAGEGVAAPEIERRARLLRDRADKLEAEYWNRGLTAAKPAFNTEPNAFLVATVSQRKPGAALDVGMGEGRNAIYLARQGWDVTGIDFADRAVALARERASAARLKLETVVTATKDYDFGRNRWDLVLFSYAGWEGIEEERVVRSLKPRGIVVVEGPLDWFGKGALPRRFGTLRVLHYEEIEAVSDFHNRRTMAIVRFVAEAASSPEQVREFWNTRFTQGTQDVTTDASGLLVDSIAGRKPGAALDLGMGEGRNALYLAANGWTVTGVDISGVALSKARQTAAARGLTFDSVEADLDAYDFGSERWDLITSFYMQDWHANSKTDIPTRIFDALKPGGMIIIEGFGPPRLKEADLRRGFERMRILRCETLEDDPEWGRGQKRTIVRFVAEKRL